jgi:hypothetical protein
MPILSTQHQNLGRSTLAVKAFCFSAKPRLSRCRAGCIVGTYRRCAVGPIQTCPPCLQDGLPIKRPAFADQPPALLDFPRSHRRFLPSSRPRSLFPSQTQTATTAPPQMQIRCQSGIDFSKRSCSVRVRAAEFRRCIGETRLTSMIPSRLRFNALICARTCSRD